MKTKNVFPWVVVGLSALFMAWRSFAPTAYISPNTEKCHTGVNWQGDEITCAQAESWGLLTKKEIVSDWSPVGN